VLLIRKKKVRRCRNNGKLGWRGHRHDDKTKNRIWGIGLDFNGRWQIPVTGSCVSGDDHFGCHNRYGIQDILDSCEPPQSALLHRVKVGNLLCSYRLKLRMTDSTFYLTPPIMERVYIYFKFPSFTRWCFWWQQHVDDDDHEELMETRNTRRKSCQVPFVYHESHSDWLGIEHGQSGERSANYRLSHGPGNPD